MLGKIGIPELLLILAIAIVIFGAKTLPKLGKAMGETIRNFKDGVNSSLGEDDAEEAKSAGKKAADAAASAGTEEAGTHQGQES